MVNADALDFLERWSRSDTTEEIREQARWMIESGTYIVGDGMPLATDPVTGWPQLFALITDFQEEDNGNEAS